MATGFAVTLSREADFHPTRRCHTWNDKKGDEILLIRGKCCEKNYSSVKRYVADLVNVYPERSITKLIFKGEVIFDVVSYQFRCALNYSKLGKLIQKLLLNQKCMGYLVRAYYSISPKRYYKDDSCWSADFKSKTTEDIITIRSFMEVLVLNHYVLGTIFGEPPYPFNYPTRRLTIEEMLAKFIDEVKGVTTRGGKMTSEATRSKEINETGINKNEPPRFEQDVQEKQHDDGGKNKSLSIHERTTQPFLKPQQSSIPFLNRVRKEKEEALQGIFLENLKQLDINIPFIEALVQIPKYAKYLKSLLTDKSRLEEACTKTMNERCSAVLLNQLTLKEKDPRSFTIPYQVLEKHKEAEDLAAYHLSTFENSHIEVLTKREIADKFFDEHLMVLKSKFINDELWYADFVYYIVGKIFPPNWTFEKRKRFFLQVKTYFWDEPYAFKLCADNIMRRCVVGSETLEILAHCHSGPTGGHHSANVTAKKVYESGFYWPSIFKDANEYVRRCDACQRSGNISSRNEMPQNNIQLNELAELRDGAYENTRIYKERTKKWHDSRLRGDKDFKVGDKVLLYNSRLKMYLRKLKSNWSSPNIIKTVYPHGAIEITDRDGVSFKVNGQRLKKYYGGNIDKDDDEVIEFKNGVT
ncbi:reverse transcriptase domain-containing protein [Tanacetum coccineum]